MRDPSLRRVETPAPPLTIAESPNGNRSQHRATPSALHDSAQSELITIVTEHGCCRTLATGLGRGESAAAIVGVHERRNDGLHIVIDPDQETVFAGDGLSRLRAEGLLSRVQFIDTAPALALPELVRRGTELDFALIQGPKGFEDVFVEFLYLDRMLVTGGFVAVSGAGEDEVSALLEFVAHARCYEPRSSTGSALPVLRKLGHHNARETPFPSRWRRRDEPDESYPEPAVRSLDAATSTGQAASTEVGATLEPATARELHLARVRAAQLETRAHQLGARLLDAELETARETSELRRQIELAEAAHRCAEHWLASITSSPSWRLTAPLRLVKRFALARFGR
jgi:hypothetical protein